MTSKPHIGTQHYEVGDIVDFYYGPDRDEPALFEGKAQIVSWDPDTQEIGFQIVDGPVGGTFISVVKH